MPAGCPAGARRLAPGDTLRLLLAGRHDLKLTWSSGIGTRIGGDFDNFAVTYLYYW